MKAEQIYKVLDHKEKIRAQKMKKLDQDSAEYKFRLN